jgi:hypothetical protein
MKKYFLPYLLPIVTIVIVISVISFNPSITGFSVRDSKYQVSGKVVVFTDSSVVIPKNSIVEVSIDNKTESISLSDFIIKNGSWYEEKTGNYPNISYYGLGYSGTHSYSLDLKDFNFGVFDSKDKYNLRVRVLYGDNILSETNQELKK